MSQTTEPNDRARNYHIIDDFARDRAGFYARRIARWLRLRRIEREDIAQNLLLALCKAAPKFDPAVASSRTFVSRVLRRAAIHEIRTAKRATACAVRNPPLLTDCTDESLELILCPTSFDHARHDLRTDVALLVGRLPLRTGRVARNLMHRTQAEAARAIGISRQAVNEHLATLRHGSRGEIFRAAL